MHRNRTTLFLVGLLAGVALPARATQITQLYSFRPNTVTSTSPWSGTTWFDQFDPSQGILDSVQIVLDQLASQDLTVENTTTEDLSIVSLSGRANLDIFANSTTIGGTPTLGTLMTQDYVSGGSGLTVGAGRSSGFGFGGGGGGGGGGGPRGSSSSLTLTGSGLNGFLGRGQTPFALWATSGWSLVGDSRLNVSDYTRIGGQIKLVYDYRVVGFYPEPTTLASLTVGLACLGLHAVWRRTRKTGRD